MLPSLFLEAEIIVEDVLSIGHFALDPWCFIVASLGYDETTLG
jgi:hypothetical protein